MYTHFYSFPKIKDREKHETCVHPKYASYKFECLHNQNKIQPFMQLITVLWIM